MNNNSIKKQPIIMTPGYSMNEQTTLPEEIWRTTIEKLKPFSMFETAIKKDYTNTIIAIQTSCKAFYNIAELKKLSNRLIAEVIKEEAWDRARSDDDYYGKNWLYRKNLN